METIEKTLRSTFEDYRLSKSEKYEFRDLLKTYKDDSDKLSFARNKAFELVNQHMQEIKRFDASAYKWLEQIVKSIDSIRFLDVPPMKDEAYFSPGNECKHRIISLIKNAKKTVDVCVFTISDDDISKALYLAHQRNINVRIITDNDKANDVGSDVNQLHQKGLPVRKDPTPNHMHHKFALIDSMYLINGSFNWTRSASNYNHENITVLKNRDLIIKFSQQFEKLWKEFKSS